jgi:hypothetical protein
VLLAFIAWRLPVLRSMRRLPSPEDAHNDAALGAEAGAPPAADA